MAARFYSLNLEIEKFDNLISLLSFVLNGLFLIDDTKDADATNDHKPKEDIKPFMTDEKMIGLIARYNDGERDIFEKAKAQLILRDKDLLTIKAMK